MSRRLLVAITVDDNADRHDLASEIALANLGDDPTVWEWPDFWADAADGVVGPASDRTQLATETVIRCADCDEPEPTGHQECAFPRDHT